MSAEEAAPPPAGQGEFVFSEADKQRLLAARASAHAEAANTAAAEAAAAPPAPAPTEAPTAPVEVASSPLKPEEQLTSDESRAILSLGELFLPRTDAKGRIHPAGPLLKPELDVLSPAMSDAVNTDFPELARALKSMKFFKSMLFLGLGVQVVRGRVQIARAYAAADKAAEEREKQQASQQRPAA